MDNFTVDELIAIIVERKLDTKDIEYKRSNIRTGAIRGQIKKNKRLLINFIQAHCNINTDIKDRKTVIRLQKEQKATLDEQKAKPDEQKEIPVEITPDEQKEIPDEQKATPDEQKEIPVEITPDEQKATPDEQKATPDEQKEIPDEQKEIPAEITSDEQRTVIIKQVKATSDNQNELIIRKITHKSLAARKEIDKLRQVITDMTIKNITLENNRLQEEKKNIIKLFSILIGVYFVWSITLPITMHLIG